MPDVKMHVYRPSDPGTARVVKNEICTASKKAAGYVRHIEFDVSGTELEGICRPGQAVGVIAPGVDARGKPHKVRLYSLACPSRGEDGQGKVLSTTVKRVIDEHWENHSLFLGVTSNFLCDCQVGDELSVSGPNGKRFIMPESLSDHDYLFLATGTGIAPFRGMIEELIGTGAGSRSTLVMGSPYESDLIYDQRFIDLENEHEHFRYLSALSRQANRDTNKKMYVGGRLEHSADEIRERLSTERALIYICGIAGMELGIFRSLAAMLPDDVLSQYLVIDEAVRADPGSWDRKMIHKQIKPTRRVFMEVYA